MNISVNWHPDPILLSILYEYMPMERAEQLYAMLNPFLANILQTKRTNIQPTFANAVNIIKSQAV